MKRYGSIFMLLAILLSFCLEVSPAVADSGNTLVLPDSLRYIAEDAFSGTGIETVVLPASVESIGSRAFADDSALSYIYIPGRTEYIADDAFAGSEQVGIYSPEGSYADLWADQHGFLHIPKNIWGPEPQQADPIDPQPLRLNGSGCTSDSDPEGSLLFAYNQDLRSNRPQDRTELPPIDYRFP